MKKYNSNIDQKYHITVFFIEALIYLFSCTFSIFIIQTKKKKVSLSQQYYILQDFDKKNIILYRFILDPLSKLNIAQKCPQTLLYVVKYDFYIVTINFETTCYLSRFTFEMPIIIPRNVSLTATLLPFDNPPLLLLVINEHTAPAAA